MSAVNVQQMAARVAELFEARLNVGGRTLAEKLRRGGRRLPRKVRREAAYLAEVAQQAQIPRLMVQIDHARAAHAYDACLRYLRPIGASERRRRGEGQGRGCGPLRPLPALSRPLRSRTC